MVSPLPTLRLGVMRPRDASGLYTQPGHQFQYWEEEGVLLKIAHGYYALVPESRRGQSWRPEIESIALALGQVDYGVNNVALMHLSAARIHSAIPRAIAVAVLAVPKQRPQLQTKFGRIVFVKRKVALLEYEKTITELGQGWVTTIEQTALDIARRPNQVVGMSQVANEAAHNLFGRCDPKKLQAIMETQRLKSAYSRLVSGINDA